MNDEGYTQSEYNYKYSIAYNTVMSITSRENLLHRMSLCKGAIDYHIKENNTSQIKFFQDELKLIERRLKLKAMA